jgi:hypothetical protein
MIVAIEGASAAGKTTWCRRYFPHHVSEAPENIVAPDLFADPPEVGKFWVNHAIENWQKALALESEHGIAVCDGDPFHLYYAWALWKSGALTSALFEIESSLYRDAFHKQRIGFVDHVLWLDVPIGELRHRAQADDMRRRKRHEIYLALVPWMTSWFTSREAVLPGTVQVLYEAFRIEELQPALHTYRYDTRMTDRMLALLGNPPAS